MDIQSIGNAVALTRKQRKLTQTQLADRLGMSRSTISGIENGTISEIGIRKILKICDFLGLELKIEKKSARPTLPQLIREQHDA
jgi:HTH-type transcriptional regulator / antitoxin HipB